MKDCVNILGTEYKIIFGKQNDFPILENNDGYTDTSAKEIIIDDMSIHENDVERKKNIESYQKQVLRHEIIHAFLAESGMDGNGHAVDHWEFNGEMIDWFAIQSPKIMKAFFETGVLVWSDMYGNIYSGTITADHMRVDDMNQFQKQIENWTKSTGKEMC